MSFNLSKPCIQNICDSTIWNKIKEYLDLKQCPYLATFHNSDCDTKFAHVHYVFQPNNLIHFKKNWTRDFTRLVGNWDDYKKLTAGNKTVVPGLKAFVDLLSYYKHHYIKVDSNDCIVLDMFNNIDENDAVIQREDQLNHKLGYAKKMNKNECGYIYDIIFNNNIRHENQALEFFKADERSFRGFKDKLKCCIEDYNFNIESFERRAFKYDTEGFTFLDLIPHNFFFCLNAYAHDILMWKHGDEERIKKYCEQGLELFELIMKTQKFSIVNFLRHVLVVMDCKNQKKNALVMSGISNGGKTTLAKLIVNAVSTGRVIMHGSASEFWLMDILHKRAIHFEECELCPTNIQEAKELFEGSTNMKIAVKGKAPTALDCRTPVIATSNQLPWTQYCNNEHLAMSNRSYIYKCDNVIRESDILTILDKYQNFTDGNKLFWSPIHFWLAYYKYVENVDLDILIACLKKYSKLVPESQFPKVPKIAIDRQDLSLSDLEELSYIPPEKILPKTIEDLVTEQDVEFLRRLKANDNSRIESIPGRSLQGDPIWSATEKRSHSPSLSVSPPSKKSK